MSTLEFVAALASALAWPVAVLVAIMLLRPTIRDLLQGSSLRRLKAGAFEFELDRVQALTGVQPPRADAPPGGALTSELAPLAAEAPTAAVLEAYARIEDELRRLMPEAEGLSGIQAVRHAAERGLISEASAPALEGLTVLRNLAAHGEGVSEQQAREFLTLAEANLYALQQQRPR